MYAWKKGRNPRFSQHGPSSLENAGRRTLRGAVRLSAEWWQAGWSSSTLWALCLFWEGMPDTEGCSATPWCAAEHELTSHHIPPFKYQCTNIPRTCSPAPQTWHIKPLYPHKCPPLSCWCCWSCWSTLESKCLPGHLTSPVLSVHVKVISHNLCQGNHHLPVCSPEIMIRNKWPNGKEIEIGKKGLTSVGLLSSFCFWCIPLKWNKKQRCRLLGPQKYSLSVLFLIEKSPIQIYDWSNGTSRRVLRLVNHLINSRRNCSIQQLQFYKDSSHCVWTLG